MKKVHIALAAWFVAMPAALLAEGTALQQLGQASGQPVKGLADGMDQVKRDLNGGPMGIPFREPQDLFARQRGCSIDVQPLRPHSIEQAVQLVQACLNKTFNDPRARLAYAVIARADYVKLPDPTDMFLVMGIAIEVKGAIPLGDTVLMDLDYSVHAVRNGSLLGFPAQIKAPERQDEENPFRACHTFAMTQPSVKTVVELIKPCVQRFAAGRNLRAITMHDDTEQIGIWLLGTPLSRANLAAIKLSEHLTKYNPAHAVHGYSVRIWAGEER